MEEARIVAGIAGEEDAVPKTLDHVTGAGVVPERVHAVAAALVPCGDRGDAQSCRFNRLPGREGPLAGLEDLVVVGLAALGIDDQRPRSEPPQRRCVEVIEVHVAQDGDVDRRQLARLERGGRLARDDEDRAREVGIGEHRAVTDANEDRRMPDPDGGDRGAPVVARHPAHGGLLVGHQASAEQQGEKRQGCASHREDEAMREGPWASAVRSCRQT